MKSVVSSLIGAAIFCGASAANAMLVDFSPFEEGDTLGTTAGSTLDLGGGVIATLTTSELGGNATGDAIVFNTNPGSASVANDPDLSSPFTNIDDDADVRAFGNALILQESGAVNPDDASQGGRITFTFGSAIELVSIFILDGADNSPTGVSLFLDGIFQQDGLGGADNEFQRVAVGSVINSFALDFAGSGAIGELEFAAVSVPEPGVLASLLLGLCGFGAMRRVRHSRSA